jgi:hypothetical protein
MTRFKFTMGFAAGALVFGSIGVAAASSSKTIDVLFNVNDVKINNISKMPEQAPFIYNGSTYVPLRYIAENLGSEVRWDSQNQTVVINSKQDNCSPSGTFDTSKYLGNWKTALAIDADKKEWDERIENTFQLEMISGNKLKLSRGDLFNSRVFYDNSGNPSDQSSSPSNWESKIFEVNSDGKADIAVTVENSEQEVHAQIEMKNNQLIVTTKEKETFFYFNQSPAFVKTE